MGRRCFESHLGPWCIDIGHGQMLLNMIKANPGLLMQDEDEKEDPKPAVHVESNIAILDLNGTMMKQLCKFDKGTSTVAMRQALRQLKSDDSIGGVLLRIESPGGRSAGTQELGDDISAVSQVKPVWSFVEDWAASAALWAAVSTDRISINGPGRTGSIGTYAVLVDSTEAAKIEGLKIEVRTTGGLKGKGVPGTPITDDLRSEVDRMVAEVNVFFLDAVEQGRGFSKKTLKEISQGQMFNATEALDIGLVDAVESFDRTFQLLSEEIQTRMKSKQIRAKVRSL